MALLLRAAGVLSVASPAARRGARSRRMLPAAGPAAQVMVKFGVDDNAKAMELGEEAAREVSDARLRRSAAWAGAGRQPWSPQGLSVPLS